MTLHAVVNMITEVAMITVIAVVFVAGIVRGFSGFGTGMIIGPTTAALFGPQMALAMIVLMDALPTLPLAWSARKEVNRTELLPVVLGFVTLAPFGIWLLKSGDPEALRWFISVSILIAVVILWSGWKYRGPRNGPVSFSFGALGGFMGAAAALPGPSVLLYWLASSARSIEVRANMIWYLFLTDLILIIGYAFSSIFTVEAVLRAAICVPGYLLGIWIGTRLFFSASDRLYRLVAYVMILIAAVTSLPVLDAVLRSG